MCRLFGFRSSVRSGVHESLIAAENALARQSMENPDGWGVAYYQKRFPHVIRSEKLAIEDNLFKDVSAVVSTRTLVAHVRKATVGKVEVLNCHPFQHGPWCFAHNGNIAFFAKNPQVRDLIAHEIDPRFLSYVLGSTDSEMCFYLFLSRLARKVEDIYHEGVRIQLALEALQETVDTICGLTDPNVEKDEDLCRLSFIVTNGALLIGYRHRRELRFSTYKTECPERDTCHAYESSRCEAEVKDGMVKHLIVTSEEISDGANVWIELDDGEYVSVDHGMNFHRGVLSDVGAPGIAAEGNSQLNIVAS